MAGAVPVVVVPPTVVVAGLPTIVLVALVRVQLIVSPLAAAGARVTVIGCAAVVIAVAVGIDVTLGVAVPPVADVVQATAVAAVVAPPVTV
jgi:hypothetical protein